MESSYSNNNLFLSDLDEKNTSSGFSLPTDNDKKQKKRTYGYYYNEPVSMGFYSRRQSNSAEHLSLAMSTGNLKSNSYRGLLGGGVNANLLSPVNGGKDDGDALPFDDMLSPNNNFNTDGYEIPISDGLYLLLLLAGGFLLRKRYCLTTNGKG